VSDLPFRVAELEQVDVIERAADSIPPPEEEAWESDHFAASVEHQRPNDQGNTHTGAPRTPTPGDEKKERDEKELASIGSVQQNGFNMRAISLTSKYTIMVETVVPLLVWLYRTT
jgi:hypothetical protein